MGGHGDTAAAPWQAAPCGQRAPLVNLGAAGMRRAGTVEGSPESPVLGNWEKSTPDTQKHVGSF
jgi:hypothetical protein